MRSRNEGGAALPVGVNAEPLHLPPGALPKFWKEYFSTEFLQLFKILKDKTYWVANRAYYNSYVAQALTPTNPSSLTVENNSTKKTYVSLIFKNRLNMDMTYENTIPSNTFPVDLPQYKQIYMMVLPIPSVNMYGPAWNGNEPTGATARCPPYFIETNMWLSFYDA